MRRGHPGEQAKVALSGRSKKPNKNIPRKAKSVSVHSHRTAETSAPARKQPIQLDATTWSRDRACRPKRSRRSSRLNRGAAIHVITANATYAMRIGVTQGLHSG